MRKQPASGSCSRCIVAIIFATLPSKIAEDIEVQKWKEHGHDAFMDFLVAYGCEQCRYSRSNEDLNLQISSQHFGCADMDVLLPSLHWMYEALGRRFRGQLPGILVDGGANVGRATSRWISALGDIFGRRAARNATQAPCIICAGSSATQGGGADGAAQAPPNVVVAAIEPSASNFVLLTKHAEEGGWMEEGFVPIHAALGDMPGEATLAITKEFAIDEIATLLFDDDDSRSRQSIRVVTLDLVASMVERAYPGIGVLDHGIFLLKLDIEGLEPAVLRSIRNARATVKFVTFEYAANVWREPLSEVIRDLFNTGYFCFLITADRLFPVSDVFWTSAYQLPMWSNFFCGLEGDPDLETVVQLHAGIVGPWPRLWDTYLLGYAADDQNSYPLLQAQRRCKELDVRCVGSQSHEKK